MKKKLIFLLSIMIIITIGGALISKIRLRDNDNIEEKINIVTSFYPIYIATANVVSDMDNIILTNLTDNQTGCLHDYQLTTDDMRKLESADIFIINGGGMESYIEDILVSYPHIKIIDTSKNIALIEGSEHHHGHEEKEDAHEEKEDAHEEKEDAHEEKEDAHKEKEDAHDEQDHDEYNAHIWLNTSNYLIQIENIKNGLLAYDQEEANNYENNAKEYMDKVNLLQSNLKMAAKNISNKEVVIFHDSFAYLANELGLEVIHTVNLDSDTSLSAGDIAEVIDEVKEHKVKVLLTEEQFSDSIALSVANETDAKVYTIDSCVTGEFIKDSYINAMNRNIETLKDALYE